MTQLPTSLPPHLSPHHHAYSLIFSLETHASQTQNQIYARILGYLLLTGPSSHARTALARDIVSCRENNEDENDMVALGKMYYDHYIYAFKMPNPHTPTPRSSSPTSDLRPSFTAMKASVVALEPPRSHTSAKHQALFRDRFRCIITGAYDSSALQDYPELNTLTSAEQTSWGTPTRCMHIIPGESVNANVDGHGAEYAASMWALLHHMGYTNIRDELSGAKIHRLENVFTLASGPSTLFTQLQLWLEPTDTPDTYTLHAANPLNIAPHFNRTVTFSTPTPDLTKYPPPSRDYLAIHAACARVAHLSGAGAYIDGIHREMEQTRVLSGDGASAEVLEHALMPLSLSHG